MWGFPSRACIVVMTVVTLHRHNNNTTEMQLVSNNASP